MNDACTLLANDKNKSVFLKSAPKGTEEPNFSIWSYRICTILEEMGENVGKIKVL